MGAKIMCGGLYRHLITRLKSGCFEMLISLAIFINIVSIVNAVHGTLKYKKTRTAFVTLNGQEVCF